MEKSTPVTRGDYYNIWKSGVKTVEKSEGVCYN